MSKGSSKLASKPSSVWGYSVSQVAILVAAFFTSQLVGSLLVVWVYKVNNLDQLLNTQKFWIVALVSGTQIILGIVWLRYIKLLGKLHRPKMKKLSQLILESLAHYGKYYLISLMLLLILAGLGIQSDQALVFDPQASGGLWLVFLALVVVVPTAEELLLRGGLFTALRNRLSFRSAAFLSAVLFGLGHGQLVVFVDTAIFGYFLASAYEKTGTIYAPIAMHALKNTYAFIYIYIIGV